ncbi:MAG: hypothetical protein IKN63_03940 [Bacilli bacterium]|nr:hypothetical protein [Bacilli bacterium]
MDYLKDLFFTDEDIKAILDANYPYIIDNLSLNSKNITEIVRYLLEIGIEKNAVKDIFINQVSFFFKTKKEIQTSFDEYELDTVVKSLNFDVNNIELIDFI